MQCPNHSRQRALRRTGRPAQSSKLFMECSNTPGAVAERLLWEFLAEFDQIWPDPGRSRPKLLELRQLMRPNHPKAATDGYARACRWGVFAVCVQRLVRWGVIRRGVSQDLLAPPVAHRRSTYVVRGAVRGSRLPRRSFELHSQVCAIRFDFGQSPRRCHFRHRARETPLVGGCRTDMHWRRIVTW